MCIYTHIITDCRLTYVRFHYNVATPLTATCNTYCSQPGNYYYYYYYYYYHTSQLSR